MEKLSFRLVLRQLPYSFLYLVSGGVAGVLFSYFLFHFNRDILKFILDIWSRRILLGLDLFKGNYALWFIFNNLIALLVIAIASVLIVFQIFRTPTFLISKRFRSMEKHRPRITLIGLYILPVCAPFLNSFLVSSFVTYILLGYGFNHFETILLLIFPHGINELIALLLASSLGLAYLKILSPLILSKKWEECIKTGKILLKSKVTIFFICLIFILAILSGTLEGLLSLFI